MLKLMFKNIEENFNFYLFPLILHFKNKREPKYQNQLELYLK